MSNCTPGAQNVLNSEQGTNERLVVELAESCGIPLVRAVGEIDLYNVGLFEDGIRRALSKDTGNLIVDLSKVAYLDSSGLSALISAYKKLQASGGKLYVIAPPESYAVRRVLEITRVDQFMCVRDSLDALTHDFEGRAAVEQQA